MSKPKALRNFATGDVYYDTLHAQAQGNDAKRCQFDVCRGSFMDIDQTASSLTTGSTLLRKATELIGSFYEHNVHKWANLAEYEQTLANRLNEVAMEIKASGSYELTTAELEFGAKLAWRNAARCPGRSVWNTLTLNDCRGVKELSEVFARLCHHIESSTNGGNIRPTISIFAQRPSRGPDEVRIWNKQLICFAGYEDEQGNVIGDKASVAFTKFCQSLGWSGNGGNFDVLPLVLSGKDCVPHVFVLPEHLVLRVRIKHPRHERLSALALEWFALPAVSSMMLEIGGVHFRCAPFSGWYSLSEIATRDLLDPQRYNLLVPIAQALDIETGRDMLWKDEVNLELNAAVLHSFNEMGVTIVDQHSLSVQFLEHFDQEHKLRGGCPADWVWLVSPESGSLTLCFHQEMLNYTLSPSILYQRELHAQYQRRLRRANNHNHNVNLKAVVRAMFFCGSLLKKVLLNRPKAFIYYATETGTARRYSVEVLNHLSQSHHALLFSLKDCSIKRILQEHKSQVNKEPIFLFVVATFGNGGPPLEAAAFEEQLKNIVHRQNNQHLLKHIRFGVLSLGSSQYPLFCQFGKELHSSLSFLGAQPLMEPSYVDCTTRPEVALSQFLEQLKSICGDEAETRRRECEQVDEAVGKGDKYHFYKALNVVQGKGPFAARLAYRHIMADGRFMLVRLEHHQHGLEAGDHVAIYPRNDVGQARLLLTKLTNKNNTQLFHPRARFAPHLSYEEELLVFYYDLCSPLTFSALSVLSTMATDPKERQSLHKLSLNMDEYRRHKESNTMDVLDIFNTFGSLKVTLNDLVQILDPLRPRLYSVASSSLRQDGSNCFDLVLALVTYTTPCGIVRQGVCSKYLSNLTLGSTVVYSARKLAHSMTSHLHEKRPTLLIGAGSGIAPLRGVWQHIKALRDLESEAPADSNLDTHLLIFGCREPKENLFDHESVFTLKRLTAFSRLKGQKKSYVQQLVANNARRLSRMVFEQQAVIVVCGAIEMAEGVRDALIKIISDEKGLEDNDEAAAILETLKRQHRYIEDVFGTHTGTNKESMPEE